MPIIIALPQQGGPADLTAYNGRRSFWEGVYDSGRMFLRSFGDSRSSVDGDTNLLILVSDVYHGVAGLPRAISELSELARKEPWYAAGLTTGGAIIVWGTRRMVAAEEMRLHRNNPATHHSSGLPKPNVTIKGTHDKPHELPQAQRFAEMQGGGEIEFYGNSSQGVEGVFRPAGQPGVELPFSLKSFHDVEKLGSLLKDIRRNSNSAQAAGVKNGVFYGEPTKFTAEQLADFAKNGPLSQAIVKDGAFTKIILKASDGLVEITPSGVRIIK